MTIKRLLGCVVLALAALSPVFAGEPTSLSQVKTLLIRDLAPSAESIICLSFLEDRLLAAGFTLSDGDSADAEMNVTLSVRGAGRAYYEMQYDVNYVIRVLSLPSRRDLFRFTGHQENSLQSACNWLAKRTLKKIAEAKKQPAAHVINGWR